MMINATRFLLFLWAVSTVSAFTAQIQYKSVQFEHYNVQQKAVTHNNSKVKPLSMASSGGSSDSTDSPILGPLGIAAGLVTLYSEFTLKNTGCGLPAGPLGLVGAVEGVSYLGIIAIAGYTVYEKFIVKEDSDNNNPLFGVAQGLSILAVVAGLVVLGFQVSDYGYIPNAVPGEGAICK